MKTISSVSLILVVLATTAALQAQVPQFIAYQGRISESGANVAGPTGQFKFALMHQNGAQMFWNHDLLSPIDGSEPDNSLTLPIENGLFSVLLGDATIPNMRTIPQTTFGVANVRLRVWFRKNSSEATFQQLSPDQKIGAVGYAMMSYSVINSAITSGKILDGTITADDLAPGAVKAAEIDDGAVSAAKLGTDVGVWLRNGATISYSGGNVGIGTPTPLADLHVLGAGATGSLIVAPNTGDSRSELFLAENPSATLGIVLRNAGDLGSNPFSIVGRNAGGTETELMTIERNGGNVGIGVSDPGVRLHVDGAVRSSGASGGNFQSYNPLNDMAHVDLSWLNDVARIRVGGSGTGAQNGLDIQTTSDRSLMRLTHEGNVGIGTATPRSGLEVVHPYADDLGQIVVRTSGSEPTYGWIGAGPSGLVIGANNVTSVNGIAFRVGTGPAASEVMRITSDRAKVNVLEITGGADLSENFDINSTSTELPGVVVCIDPESPGQLVPSSKAYDRTVAGIVSGAGGVNPGMLMGQHGTKADGKHPVALTGRVYCLVDADQGAIQPGDLITTSDTLGHGMKVIDSPRAQGAIIGKAMTKLEKGKGLVLVLVSLQ